MAIFAQILPISQRMRLPVTLRSPSIAIKQLKLECGPMPNVMVTLPNTGGALCSMPQSLADAHY